MDVASAHVYPVKGMRALDVSGATVEPRGLAGDRRWLVVDPHGEFQTQRSAPGLARISAIPTADGIRFSHADSGDAFACVPDGAARREVRVWGATVDAAAAPDADSWLSDVLKSEVRLVFMDARAVRLKTSVWTPAPVVVSFADAFPVLVTTTGSLAALNRDIAEHGGAPVPMTRFRPNIVVDCDEPWAEDRWSRLSVGEAVLDLVKASDRCIVTTTDQETGARTGPEPLAALARLRRSTDPRINGVLFGVNAVPAATGRFRVGDAVEVS